MKTIRIFLFSILLFTFSIHIYSQDIPADEIFAKFSDAVVVIVTYDENGKVNSQGSGIILNDKGIVVTNFHVFAGSEKIEIKHKDAVIENSGVVGVNIEKDILILKIDGSQYPDIPFANADELKVGQKVYTIGSPLGLENSMSEGIISGFRKIGKTNKSYTQISASISPGSSGGAVLNSKGELVGMSTSTYEDGQNINFAIPVEEILKVTAGNYNPKETLEALHYFYKGYNAFKDGKYDESIESYSKYIGLSPNEAKIYNYRGLSYAQLEKYKSATEDYNKAIKLDSAYAAPYYNRGEVYFKQEEYDKAIKDFTKVIRIDPDNYNAYNARGLAYSKNEQYDKSTKDFTKVIDLEPDYVAGYINRGLSDYYAKDFEHAIQDWKKAIDMQPSLEKDLRPLINMAFELWRYK
jgi:Flp pilus assembly protein TadD